MFDNPGNGHEYEEADDAFTGLVAVCLIALALVFLLAELVN